MKPLPAFLIAAALLVTLGGPAPAQDAPEPAGTPSEFAGMVEVKGGQFEMGVDVKYLQKTYEKDKRSTHSALQGKNKEVWWPILLLETPEHRVKVEDYAMDRYAVTDAQYREFLEDACKTSVHLGGKLVTIYDVAVQVYGENPSDWQMQSIYLLNQATLEKLKAEVLTRNAAIVKSLLDKQNEGLPEDSPARVKEFDGLPDKERAKGWQNFKLPEGTALIVYTRTMPANWTEGKPNQGEESHPVRFVTALDADAFAEWAGRHLPTEAEWERAARGPKNRLYPWGDEWNCDTQRNLLVWSGADPAPRGPAMPARDRPAAVDVCATGQSPFGCFNMLGNVMQWTSSIPRKYPGSKAPFAYFGQANLRVVRGSSYGQGYDYQSKEISIRNTARLVEAYEPIAEVNAYEAVGFRCAKYLTPARDCLAHRVKASVSVGRMPTGLELDPAKGYGVEANENQANPKHHVYVSGMTRFLGVTPVKQLDFATTRNILSAAEKALEAGPVDAKPVLLGHLQWNGDLAVKIWRIPVPEKVDDYVPPPEGEGEGDEGEEGEGDEGEGDGEKPDGGEEPADGEKPGPVAPAPGPVAPAPGPVAPAPGEVKPGEEPTEVPEPGEEPVEPVVPVEKPEFLQATEHGFLLGVYGNRIALFTPGLTGLSFSGYLTPEGTPEPETLVVMQSGKEFTRLAKLDVEAGVIDLQLPLLTRSKTSKNVFGISLKLHVKGSLDGAWRNTTK